MPKDSKEWGFKKNVLNGPHTKFTGDEIRSMISVIAVSPESETYRTVLKRAALLLCTGEVAGEGNDYFFIEIYCRDVVADILTKTQ